MIPLTMMCLLGGCLDLPVDTRSPERQIKDSISRQFPGRQARISCYVDGVFYYDCMDAVDKLDKEEEDD